MNKYFMIAVGISLSTSAYGTSLSSDDWNNFYSTSRSSCIDSQSNNTINYGVSVGEINTFCSCYARSMANAMSYELLSYINNTGDSSQLITIANNAGYSCAN